MVALPIIWKKLNKLVRLELIIGNSEVLIEKSILGWKEYELEVMQDRMTM